MKEKIITGIYIRVSTEEQARDGFSIHAQREKLTKYAEANDWHVFDFYIDNGISGKNLNKRPEITRLLQDIQDGKVNNVLIYKLDRLTRSVKDLIYLIDFFEKNKCTFNSQTEKIDTSNAVGRMFVKIIGIFAEFERENLAERVSFGYEQKTREGNYTNTNGVYGYDYVVGIKKLIVNEEEKKLVNKIFDLYIEGKSCFKIANIFNDKSIPTKRGGKWAPSTIKSIINNPLYIGKVRYGVRNKNKSFIAEGKNIKPIIAVKKWNLANMIMKNRKNIGVRRYPSENSYFFHFIKCVNCGEDILVHKQTHKGKLYVTYCCGNLCQGFSHKILEKAFLDYLSTLGKMNFNINPNSLIDKYDEIRDIVTNLNLNWQYLTNKEKQQFLERFVKKILVKKINNQVMIQDVVYE